MTQHPTAQVVSTHEPERPKFHDGPVVESVDRNGHRLIDLIPACVIIGDQLNFRTGQGFACRVLRLPSEQEASLAPFVAARDAAAVAVARMYASKGACGQADDLSEAFAKAQSALGAAIAAQKGTT